MNDDELNRLHECQMVILDEIVEFCDKNNLKYFLTGGSALGAIRHKGFIPWDDDIDIAMTRKDYNYLIENYKDNDRFYLQCIEKDANYWNFFAKMRMKNTMMEEERIIDFDFPKEIFVDIFPIDNAPSGGYRKVLINANLVKINYSAFWLKHKIINISDCRFKLVESLVSLLPKKTIYNLTKRIMTSHKNDNSDYVIDYLSPYAIRKEYLPRTTYFETTKCHFEDREYMIPKDADKYLTSVYGDYMILPPIEERVTHKIGRISFDTQKDGISNS